MKGRIFACLLGVIALGILLLSEFLLPVSMAIPNQTLWYVATYGSDSRGNGSVDKPWQTIQRAIDSASDGDKVIVLEGRYAGPGNVNLNFKGKAITLQSRDPEDDACVLATIIDSQRNGVIIRFINDEGPESVLDGFSLVGGDSSITVQGVPGFFEFSEDAHPTTKRLRIVGDGSLPDTDYTTLMASAPPFGGRAWDGNNPFHQPATTTDYNGSGDVDGDGTLTGADVSLAQEMADGLATPSPRADVDGDGEINLSDVTLINGALAGNTLPGWWNSLLDRAERNAWVTQIIAIDQTDQHPWTYWFQCLSFAVQTLIRAAFYRGDLFYTFYDAGPTRFNLPLYYVSISGPSYGHGINGILVGEDPLNFDDWRFLEPQTDFDVAPGMWDMPFGTTVSVGLPLTIWRGGFSGTYKVIFEVLETGWTLKEYSPDLILTRPVPDATPPDNRPDFWNPHPVPGNPGMVFFERTRQDMSHVTDIHLTELPFLDPPAALPVVMSSLYSRLLDVHQGEDGTLHLLWQSKVDYIPGVFYGRMNPTTREISDVTRVSTGARMIQMGRVIESPATGIHVFWLENKSNLNHPYDTGIYWTRWTESGWLAEHNIAPYLGYLSSYPTWETRDSLRYYFDVSALPDGSLALVWAEPIEGTKDVALLQRLYDGNWGTRTMIDTVETAGVELLTDSTGTLHLVYWLVNDSTSQRGNLLHRSYDGSSWSAPETVDASGSACCPRMVEGLGNVVLVWEREGGNQVFPVWRRYRSGKWHTEQTLYVQSGADAWYPTAAFLSDGDLAIAWSSRSADRVTIETAAVTFYGLTLGPPMVVQSGFPGATLTYTLEVTKSGTVTDTFDVNISGNTWQTTGPTTVGPLAPGDNTHLDVVVNIPSETAIEPTDVATVTVTSRGNDTLSANATLVSYTLYPHAVYLPLITHRTEGQGR